MVGLQPKIVTAPTVDTVTVTPATTASLLTGATQNFTAAVKMSDGSTNSAGVTWSVTGGGTIAQTGVYTAPSAAQSTAVTITATSKADTSVSGTATVTRINAPTPVLKTIALSPTALSIKADGSEAAKTVTITAATDSGAALPAAGSITVTGDTGTKLAISAVTGTGASRTFTVNGKSGTTNADSPITLTVTAGSGITKTIVVTLTA